jgi:uncharacterized membrane protein
MIEFILALLAPFFFALGILEAKRGLENSNYLACIFVMTAIGVVILIPCSIATTEFSTITCQGLVLFFLEYS